jgi:hypothetical protein
MCVEAEIGVPYRKTEGYFMSQEQQDAVVGRTVREMREAEEKLAKLEAEARTVGEALMEIGRALCNSPAHLIEEGQSYNTKFAAGPRGGMGFYRASQLISADKLKSLTEDVRATMLEFDRLNETLQRMGFKR